MISIGTTHYWVKNLMQAGYTDKQIEDIIDKQLIEGVLLLFKQHYTR